MLLSNKNLVSSFKLGEQQHVIDDQNKLIETTLNQRLAKTALDEKLQDRIKQVEEERLKLEKDRRDFTQAAIRMGMERANLDVSTSNQAPNDRIGIVEKERTCTSYTSVYLTNADGSSPNRLRYSSSRTRCKSVLPGTSLPALTHLMKMKTPIRSRLESKRQQRRWRPPKRACKEMC
jgi:hypothetical protein